MQINKKSLKNIINLNFMYESCLNYISGSIQCYIEQGDFEHANEQVKAYKQLETEFSPVSIKPK